MIIKAIDVISYLKELGQYIQDNAMLAEADRLSSLENSKPGSICFIKDNNYDLSLNQSTILIVGEMFVQQPNLACTIKVKDPRFSFAKIAEKFFAKSWSRKAMISPKASIAKSAKIGRAVIVMDHVVIGEDCEIGNNVLIHPNVTIYDKVKIGNHVIIHAGSVIGCDGFGYVKNSRNEYEKFPHYGSVVIGENVEIGANSCIDAGTIDDTTIGSGAKIDDLCYVAHNATIGKNCILTAGTKIFGSVKCEDNVWFGPAAVTNNKIHIGKNAFIGMGAVVVHDVEEMAVVVGNPARKIRGNNITIVQQEKDQKSMNFCVMLGADEFKLDTQFMEEKEHELLFNPNVLYINTKRPRITVDS